MRLKTTSQSAVRYLFWIVILAISNERPWQCSAICLMTAWTRTPIARLECISALQCTPDGACGHCFDPAVCTGRDRASIGSDCGRCHISSMPLPDLAEADRAILAQVVRE